MPFRPQKPTPQSVFGRMSGSLVSCHSQVDVSAFRRCGFWALVLIQTTTSIYRISRRFQPTSFSACVRARKTTRALQLQAAFTPAGHNTARSLCAATTCIMRGIPYTLAKVHRTPHSSYCFRNIRMASVERKQIKLCLLERKAGESSPCDSNTE